MSNVHFQVVEALRATSAAPTYFDGIEIKGKDLVDGGLGANCPAGFGM